MANLTDVQPIKADGELGFGFGIVEDRGGTARIWFVYATEDEAKDARAKVEDALSEAIQVVGVGA